MKENVAVDPASTVVIVVLSNSTGAPPGTHEPPYWMSGSLSSTIAVWVAISPTVARVRREGKGR